MYICYGSRRKHIAVAPLDQYEMDAPYTPLDPEQREIRLLELAPGGYNDDLVITLRIESLRRELPEFHALSYAWGQQTSPQKAVVNQKSMTIGLNLDRAFRHLRCGLTKSKLMWVDAICINQLDLKERSSQVLLMKDIYSSAERVQIYLGPEGSGDASLISLIEDDVVPRTEDDFHILLTHVESFCQRPWFGRVWVAQELALSERDPTIYIGTKNLPWSKLYEYVVSLESRKPSSLEGHPRITSYMESIERVRRLGRVRSVPTTSLVLQIFRLAPALATDPRDKVYGLLGICASAFNETTVKPDYTKSTTRVFTEATVAMLHEPCHLPYGLMPLQPPRILSPGCFYQRLPDLPSWVFDLNISSQALQQYCEMGPYWMIPERAMHPGAFLPYTDHIPDRVRVSHDFKRLYTFGRHVGTISAVFPSSINLNSYAGYQTRLKALRDIYRTHMKPRQISAQSLLGALTVDRKTPVLDSNLFGQLPEVFEDMLNSDEAVTFPSQSFDVLVALSGHEECHVFFTDNDLVGIAYHPDSTNGIRVGDKVVGLFGINFPFLLRTSSERQYDSPAYTMVNITHIADHEWQHDFLIGTGPKAQWSDFGKDGLQEYMIV